MRKISLHIVVGVSTIVVALLVWQFYSAVIVFGLSLAIAAALRPIVDRIEQRGYPRRFAIALTYILPVGGTALVVLPLAGLALGELQLASRDVAAAYDHAAHHWPEGTPIQKRMALMLPPPNRVHDLLVSGNELKVARTVLGITIGAIEFSANLLVILVLSIYWTIDRVHFERLWLSVLDVRNRVRARQMWRSLEAELGAYLRSEFVQSLVAAGLLAAGFWGLGHPYPLLLACAIAVAWLIPWIGALIAVVAVTSLSLPMAITNGWDGALVLVAGVVMTFLVLTIMECVVEPRLFNRQRYHALFMAVVTLILAEAIGVLGLFVGPLFAMAVEVLLGELYASPTPAETAAKQPLTDRISHLQSTLATIDSPPPEVLSLVNRLTELVAESGLGEETGNSEATHSAAKVAHDTA